MVDGQARALWLLAAVAALAAIVVLGQLITRTVLAVEDAPLLEPVWAAGMFRPGRWAPAAPLSAELQDMRGPGPGVARMDSAKSELQES